MSETFHSDSPEQTLEIGRRIAERLEVGDCVALVGPLGAGKTVLARGLAIGLGLEQANRVSSPTYVLVHEYAGRAPIFHLDLYRMDDADVELPELGLDEMLETGVVLIEWADRADAALPDRRCEIHIDILAPDRRRLTLTGP